MIKILNRKAQVDQTITSLVILFAVFFLMLIFVLASTNIGGIGKFLGKNDLEITSSNSNIQKINSQALADMFLTDEISIDSQKMFIIDSIKNLNENNELTVAKAIQDKFDKDYSCSGKNFLSLRRIKSATSGSSKTAEYFTIYQAFAYIQYPESKESLWMKESSYAEEGTINPPVPDNAYDKIVAEKDNVQYVIYVKENAKC